MTLARQCDFSHWQKTELIISEQTGRKLVITQFLPLDGVMEDPDTTTVMNEDELNSLAALRWMPSRIPKLSALCAFVADGAECPEAVSRAAKGTQSRWYPQPGGHRVVILYEGGPYDAETFTMEPEGWDHENCSVCGERIAPMTLCHVTEKGTYILLCESCYTRFVAQKASS